MSQPPSAPNRAEQRLSGLWTSESVTEGHPDKVCDQISDAVLDACLAQDSSSRVACETAVSSDLVVVFGEITTSASLDIEQIVRHKLREIGYTHSDWGIDAATCKVLLSINRQSSDIFEGVFGTEQGTEEQGAGDQGMMFGYACNETEHLMPLPISLAHDLTRQLAHARRSDALTWLRPDGKSQVTVEYADGRPTRVDAIVISTQHEESVTQEEIAAGIRREVIGPIVPPELIDDATEMHINPSGHFVIGGPLADAGLTGRKIIVDTYGGMARHGGGAFSGKDPSKVDRSAAYAARYVAKNIVGAGLAERVELQISYAIGRARPTSLAVETFGTGRLSNNQLTELVLRHFDLRPAAIIQSLKLKRPIYGITSTYGHFGRAEFSWEAVDQVESLRRAAGIDEVAPGERLLG